MRRWHQLVSECRASILHLRTCVIAPRLMRVSDGCQASTDDGEPLLEAWTALHVDAVQLYNQRHTQDGMNGKGAIDEVTDDQTSCQAVEPHRLHPRLAPGCRLCVMSRIRCICHLRAHGVRLVACRSCCKHLCYIYAETMHVSFRPEPRATSPCGCKIATWGMDESCGSVGGRDGGWLRGVAGLQSERCIPCPRQPPSLSVRPPTRIRQQRSWRP